jgi:hypothetical protein
MSLLHDTFSSVRTIVLTFRSRDFIQLIHSTGYDPRLVLKLAYIQWIFVGSRAV